uniref:Uncharacterized protein n=1 Tax=Rhizophora mucronata TaxID=61149 RepID=A0A2P2Q179_RHIMU
MVGILFLIYSPPLFDLFKSVSLKCHTFSLIFLFHGQISFFQKFPHTTEIGCDDAMIKDIDLIQYDTVICLPSYLVF